MTKPSAGERGREGGLSFTPSIESGLGADAAGLKRKGESASPAAEGVKKQRGCEQATPLCSLGDGVDAFGTKLSPRGSFTATPTDTTTETDAEMLLDTLREDCQAPSDAQTASKTAVRSEAPQAHVAGAGATLHAADAKGDAYAHDGPEKQTGAEVVQFKPKSMPGISPLPLPKYAEIKLPRRAAGLSLSALPAGPASFRPRAVSLSKKAHHKNVPSAEKLFRGLRQQLLKSDRPKVQLSSKLI